MGSMYVNPDRHLWDGAYGPSTGSQAGRRHDRVDLVIVGQGQSMLLIDGVHPKSSGPGRRHRWWKHRCVSEASATERLTAVLASLATMVAWSGWAGVLGGGVSDTVVVTFVTCLAWRGGSVKGFSVMGCELHGATAEDGGDHPRHDEGATRMRGVTVGL